MYFITSITLYNVPGYFQKQNGIRMNQYRPLWDVKYVLSLYFSAIVDPQYLSLLIIRSILSIFCSSLLLDPFSCVCCSCDLIELCDRSSYRNFLYWKWLREDPVQQVALPVVPLPPVLLFRLSTRSFWFYLKRTSAITVVMQLFKLLQSITPHGFIIYIRQFIFIDRYNLIILPSIFCQVIFYNIWYR